MNSSGAPLVAGSDVRKTYVMGASSLEVLKGVDIAVNPGEFVAIMGASGSGKSTLLHLLGALDTPTSGGVSFNAQPLTSRSSGLRPWVFFLTFFLIIPAAMLTLFVISDHMPEKLYFVAFFATPPALIVALVWLHSMLVGRQRDQLRNQDFGFVFQFYHLLPELNVLENVMLPAMIAAPWYAIFGMGRPSRQPAIDLLTRFGLGDRLKHRPAQLSGGERQRAAIARALINKPAVLLADEPTGNLDAKTGRTIMDVLVDLHRNHGQTILLVTHDPHIAAMADRTIHLDDGRIVA